MARVVRLQSALRSLGGAVLLLCAAAGALAADEPKRGVESPHYGDGLFHFYQEQYFSAITGLMVSQHFDRLAPHADDTEVLRGGMLLSYGMHKEAGEVFARLIDQGAAAPVRDRAWFYLAKIRYQRGYLADAQAALSRIAGPLPVDLEEDRLLLQANLLIAAADYTGAVKLLSGVTVRNGASKLSGNAAYLRFNLGVALIKSGDVAQGSALLDQIGSAAATDEEQRALRDRANLALGFAALAKQQPQQAKVFLERVRLSSLQANKALLGYGWAAAELKNPKQALVPWSELAQRDPSDAAVLEARIAVPYAYAELGARGQALERYNQAIVAFDAETQSLDSSIASIRAGTLLTGLLERNPGSSMGWFWSIRSLPAMPHAGHLAPLLAQHEFQEAFKNYRDLQFLTHNLQGWADNLGVFGDMLGNRRKAFAERLPQVRARTPQHAELAALRQRRDVLAAELAQAVAASDGVAFHDARQGELLARLASARSALAALPVDGQPAGAQDRLRLAAGVMTWDLAQQYPQRLHRASRALLSIEAQIDSAGQRDVALTQAQRDEPARFEAFAARIAQLEQRIQALTPRAMALAREQQEQIQELAVAELLRQKQRLAAYATQARFAVAQLYDRATLATHEAGDAKQP
jgi:Tetratricopeptide repeat